MYVLMHDGGTFFLAGQREGVLPHAGELPGSQQSDGGGVHPVHTGRPHTQRQSGREGGVLVSSGPGTVLDAMGAKPNQPVFAVSD